jgi:hypothetical protein
VKKNRLKHSTNSTEVPVTKGKGQGWAFQLPVKWFKRTKAESEFSVSRKRKQNFIVIFRLRPTLCLGEAVERGVRKASRFTSSGASKPGAAWASGRLSGSCCNRRGKAGRLTYVGKPSRLAILGGTCLRPSKAPRNLFCPCMVERLFE